MFQPTTTEIGPEAAQPERETVIKFVISGPFLNAEAARTEWSAEPPPPAPALEDLLRRIADLERKLDEERTLVEELSRQIPAAPAPAPAPRPTPGPAPAPLPDAVTTHVVEEPGIAAPAPPSLTTVARTPPPKVRGLRRMIGALRHL